MKTVRTMQEDLILEYSKDLFPPGVTVDEMPQALEDLRAEILANNKDNEFKCSNNCAPKARKGFGKRNVL